MKHQRDGIAGDNVPKSARRKDGKVGGCPVSTGTQLLSCLFLIRS